jgi:hypothetical protein
MEDLPLKKDIITKKIRVNNINGFHFALLIGQFLLTFSSAEHVYNPHAHAVRVSGCIVTDRL